MAMLAPSNFKLTFPVEKKDLGPALMEVLADYLKNCDYMNLKDGLGHDSEIDKAQWVSRMFFELKTSSLVGSPTCYVTMWSLEFLPDLVNKYRQTHKVNHHTFSLLWMILEDMIKKAKTWQFC